MNQNKDALMTELNALRDVSLEVFKDRIRELNKDDSLDGHDVLVGAAASALDTCIVGQLNMVYEKPDYFVDNLELEPEGSGVNVVAKFTKGLAEYYINQVSN